MKKVINLSLACGLLCGLWIYMSSFTSLEQWLNGWIGFGGCTVFFAYSNSQSSRNHRFIISLVAVLSGMAWALLALYLPSVLGPGWLSVFTAAALGFILCFQSQIYYLSFIPGAFIGAFVTFGAAETLQVLGDDFLKLVLSLIGGVVLAYAIDLLTEVFNQQSTK